MSDTAIPTDPGDEKAMPAVEQPGDESAPPTEEAAPKRRARRRRASISAEVDNATTSDFVPKVIPKTPEEEERLRKAVASNFLFSALDDEQRNQVFGAMEEKKIPAGTEVIAQGDPGDFFYVLDTGAADVFVNGEKVHHYDAGTSFGELALMYNCPRAASVKTTEDCTLWALDRQTFRQILYANQSKKRNDYEGFLKKCDLFEGLTDTEITRVADVLEERAFAKGTVVLHEGDEDFGAMKFYLVIKGNAVATKATEEGQEPLKVGQVGPGGFFGEKALIEHAPRAATVSAATDLVCACLDVAAFERLLGSCKSTMQTQIDGYSGTTSAAHGSAVNAVRALTPSHSQEGGADEPAQTAEEQSAAASA